MNIKIGEWLGIKPLETFKGDWQEPVDEYTIYKCYVGHLHSIVP